MEAMTRSLIRYISIAVFVLSVAITFGVYNARNKSQPLSNSQSPVLGSGAMFDVIAPYYDLANKVRVYIV